jgi:NADH:ubiquinone oxidoreductase subunit 6 (subunit J)
MNLIFFVLAAMTLAGAIAAMSLRNLVHCALALTGSFAGLAALYLQLGAQFVGFAQILIYIGAVAILIVFAILLTGGHEARRASEGERFNTQHALMGLATALVVFGVLAGMVLASRALPRQAPPAPEATVRQIGEQLMTKYILPLEVVGLLLTAALIGAVIIAMHERRRAE